MPDYIRAFRLNNTPANDWGPKVAGNRGGPNAVAPLNTGVIANNAYQPQTTEF